MKGGIPIIGGISITALIVFLFQMWVADQVIDATLPAVENALAQLDDLIVCPPEFTMENYEVCVSGEGDVIANGVIHEILTLNLDSEIRNEVCSMYAGQYYDKKICRFTSLGDLGTFTLILKGTSVSKSLSSKSIESYIASNKFVKIPVKQWKGLVKVIKYIPK